MGGNSHNEKDDNGDELVRTCDPVTIREWEANEAALRREDAPGRNCSLPEDNNARGCTGRLLEILYLALIHIVALIHNRDDENPAIMEESLLSEGGVRGPNGVGFNISPSGFNSMEITAPPVVHHPSTGTFSSQRHSGTSHSNFSWIR